MPLACFGLALLTGGCSLLFSSLPEPTTLDERLAAFPQDGLDVKEPVTIHWNAYQVPYVKAANADDAAYTLGLIHAHLRLGQMEIVRRVTQGRIAEMAGPPVTDIDIALRTLGFYRGASESVALMPPETRAWVDRFVAGINDYITKGGALPFEYKALRFEYEPWTPEDIVAIGRIAAIDVNWFKWFRLFPERNNENFAQILDEALRPGREDPVSFGHAGVETRETETEDPAMDEARLSPTARRIASVLMSFKRPGSNSLVVSGEKSASGAGMIASDPHLGFLLPNVWLLAGLKTPDIQVVGFMGPGLPIFGLARTPEIAWGGTNLHGGASELVDVSGLPENRFEEETYDIDVRAWFDKTATARVTPYGPVISDVALVREALQLEDGEALALRWMNHLPSDDVSAFLNVLKAKNFPEFREAFAGYSQPGQNMLYADRSGSIGQIIAARLPKRGPAPPADLVVLPEQSDRNWAEFVNAVSLPAGFNPEQGFFASSNNRPAATETPVSYFFAAPDRFLRQSELLQGFETVGIEDLRALQLDVYSQAAADLQSILLERLAFSIDSGALELEEAQDRVWRLVAAWDAEYHADSEGALAFEAFVTALARELAPETKKDADTDEPADANIFRKTFAKMLADVDVRELTNAVPQALETASDVVEEFGIWGEMHRLVIAYPLNQAPVVGGKFPSVDLPGNGSSETLQKTAHNATLERHEADYGSQARHISDLSDPDANYFVLAGGQDGWLNSSTFADQMALWSKGEYIQMPLSDDAVARDFPIVMRLDP